MLDVSEIFLASIKIRKNYGHTNRHRKNTPGGGGMGAGGLGRDRLLSSVQRRRAHKLYGHLAS